MSDDVQNWTLSYWILTELRRKSCGDSIPGTFMLRTLLTIVLRYFKGKKLEHVHRVT